MLNCECYVILFVQQFPAQCETLQEISDIISSSREYTNSDKINGNLLLPDILAMAERHHKNDKQKITTQNILNLFNKSNRHVINDNDNNNQIIFVLFFSMLLANTRQITARLKVSIVR